MSDLASWGAGLMAVASIAGGAWAWLRVNRRNESRDTVEMVKDRAEVNIVENLERRCAELQKRLDDTEPMERDYFIAIADLRTMYKNQDRLKRKLRHAGVEDSEIGTLIEETATDFAALPNQPPP